MQVSGRININMLLLCQDLYTHMWLCLIVYFEDCILLFVEIITTCKAKDFAMQVSGRIICDVFINRPPLKMGKVSRHFLMRERHKRGIVAVLLLSGVLFIVFIFVYTYARVFLCFDCVFRILYSFVCRNHHIAAIPPYEKASTFNLVHCCFFLSIHFRITCITQINN